MPSTLSPGRILLALVGVVSGTGCFIADWNETHIYNPNWPPHAKFHNGQTMSMGVCLGLSTIYYALRPNSSPTLAKESLFTATIFASMYWATQASALMYPGAKSYDPEFGTGNPQLYIDAVLLSCVTAGYLLESKRIAKHGKAS